MTLPTDDELLAIASKTAGAHWFDHAHVLRFARAVLAAAPQAVTAQHQPLPTGLRLAAAFTRADLGPDGSNYPHVRELLAFAEQALGITAAPEAQKGEKK